MSDLEELRNRVDRDRLTPLEKRAVLALTSLGWQVMRRGTKGNLDFLLTRKVQSGKSEVVWVEVKAVGSSFTRSQVRRFTKLTSEGARIFIVDVSGQNSVSPIDSIVHVSEWLDKERSLDDLDRRPRGTASPDRVHTAGSGYFPRGTSPGSRGSRSGLVAGLVVILLSTLVIVFPSYWWAACFLVPLGLFMVFLAAPVRPTGIAQDEAPSMSNSAAGIEIVDLVHQPTAAPSGAARPGLRQDRLRVVLTIRNNTGQDLRLIAWFFKVELTNGSRYSADSVDGPDEIAPSGEGQVGVVWKLPSGSEPRSIIYEPLGGERAVVSL